MSAYSILLGHQRHVFDDLKAVMAAASPEKSGDQLAGIAADTNERRVAARYVLADIPLIGPAFFRHHPMVYFAGRLSAGVRSCRSP